MFDFKTEFRRKLEVSEVDYTVYGFIGRDGIVYPLGSDTKVLSTIFELLTRPLVYQVAAEHDYRVVEPTSQNYYPDFTLVKDGNDTSKIAVDVKTTYLTSGNTRFNFTLGGYTSFIRVEKEAKNIVYPFSQYAEHWVVGYVYKRRATRKAEVATKYNVKDLSTIPLPYDDVKVFVEEKWKIASDHAGSGNTTNIGSITGEFDDFEQGRSPFENEEEFLEYWRNYERTAPERAGKFSNISEFREWRRGNA